MTKLPRPGPEARSFVRPRRAAPWRAALPALAILALGPRALLAEIPDGSSWRSLPLPAPEPAPRNARGVGSESGMSLPWGEPSFERFRATWLSEGGKKWFAAVMGRAAPYMPYITERIRYYGLPEELLALPLIESEFSPRAVSRSGATGLWQFMRNSIGGYGIRLDDWVDERRDFMKSTDAALRKLADNKAALGDWELALAAYNAGLGAVTRARQKAPGSSYWELRDKGLLPKETVSYVPKFLAAVSILLYPARNGLPLRWDEPVAWETVEIGRSVDLGLLAEAAKIDLETLRHANAELRYGVTPPWPGYALKVPAGKAEAVRAALADPSLKLLRYYFHKVASGDTLSAISRHYGTPQELIVRANPGLQPDRIQLGQSIVVPALKEAGPMARPATDELPDFSGTHVVARGETLWSLSLRYEVSPEVLAERNGLELGALIREGFRLRVPILQ
jgi:membrane-bound lytic murein transglycosylase D